MCEYGGSSNETQRCLQAGAAARGRVERTSWDTKLTKQLRITVKSATYMIKKIQN